MGERRGTRALELWCKRMTEGYPGVKIDNMTTSWRDGLAFCAIIHHFRPDLIDFSKLSKDNIYDNNNLAFRIAEDRLGIPALLEPEDMVEYSVPDRLSILTYLSQFYQAFAGNQSNSPTKSPPKRPPPADLQMHMVSSTSASPPKKAALRLSGARREPCAKCGLPVFIAERLNVGKALYHRTCFRCARCDSQLTLANYYETENNEFCCETCPDEEKTIPINASILNKSLSDEEKSASLKGETDQYSASFENVLECTDDGSLRRNFTLDRGVGSHFMKARSDFMTTQVDSSSTDSDSSNENKPPDLPPSQISHCEEDNIEHSENIDAVGSNLLPSLSDSVFPSFKLKDRHDTDQKLYESQDPITKDSISTKDESRSPSIKSRIKLFEGNVEDRLEIRKSDVNKESLNLSEQIDEVPYEKPSVETSVSVEQSNENNEELLKQNEFKEILEIPRVVRESVISVIGNETNESGVSEGYRADVSDLNNSSAQNKSIISISSENLSVENNSISVYSTQNDLTKSGSSESGGKDISVIVISDSSDEQLPIKNHSSEEVPLQSEIPSKTGIEELSSQVTEYPDDLNPFGDDENSEVVNQSATSKAVSLNPFGDSDEEEEELGREDKPIPAPRLIVPPKGSNPFGSDCDEDDDDEDEKLEELSSLPPQPAARKLLKPPKTSLTPYWDDDKTPVPKPRSPRTPARNASDASSLTGSGRKKKPAPKPPTASSVFSHDANDSPLSSITSSPSQSVCHSPKVTPKTRKMRRAPLPPETSTPFNSSKSDDYHKLTDLSPIEQSTTAEDIENKPLQFRVGSEENLKSVKNEMNRSRQHSSNIPLDNGPSSLPNKSTYGKWKRRKGQAPARPIPQRRSIKSLPIGEIKNELDLIEVQQLGLEKQGVRLEKLIRERSEVPGSNEDEALPPEVEDMVLQLFELVNEKNELFRKQTELMYLRRQHRLEEEHAEIEYQIRCLMLQPEPNKTDSDKAKEEELINRLVEIVERRNEIVDCLEMERQREADEDTSISNQLTLFSMKRDEDKQAIKKISKKDKSKHKKDKERKSKSKNKVDADKDIDECEKASLKEKKKKKKFNLF